MSKEQVEEYIEAIYDIAGKNGLAKTTEVAKRLHNAPASVTEVFQSLAESGLVRYEPYKGVALTEAGEKVALKIKRKHRLLEVFLSEILGIDPEKVHEEACRMEHSVSDEVGDAMCRMLNAPARCPDGKLIYPCEKEIATCNECRDGGRGERPGQVLPAEESGALDGSAALPERDHRTSSRRQESHSEALRPWPDSRDRGRPDEKNAHGWAH